MGLDQPDYINAVVQVETDLGPEQLFLELQEIERRHGREEQHEHWGVHGRWIWIFSYGGRSASTTEP